MRLAHRRPVDVPVPPVVEGRAERRLFEPDLAGQAGEHVGTADVEPLHEERFENAVVVLVSPAVFLRELEPLPRQVCVRLRRHRRQADRDAHPPGQRVHRLHPRPLQVLALRPERGGRLRPQLERHPLDHHVLPLHRLGQRKLRQIAERSDEVRVHADQYAHVGLRFAGEGSGVSQANTMPTLRECIETPADRRRSAVESTGRKRVGKESSSFAFPNTSRQENRR